MELKTYAYTRIFCVFDCCREISKKVDDIIKPLALQYEKAHNTKGLGNDIAKNAMLHIVYACDIGKLANNPTSGISEPTQLVINYITQGNEYPGTIAQDEQIAKSAIEL